MKKAISYFIQSIIIFLFFIFGKIVGIKISRKIFSFVFTKIGPIFRSKKIIEKNLNIFEKNMSDEKKKIIISEMWKNYGMTFIEYTFLKYFKKIIIIYVYRRKNLERIFKIGKPVIFVSGHFANFELMSMEITKKISS